MRRSAPLVASLLLALAVGSAEGVTSASCVGPATSIYHIEQAAHHSIYDKASSPHQACGNPAPVIVQAQFHLVYLDRVDQVLGQVTLGGYLRQWWKDDRLAYNTTANGGCFDLVQLPPNFDPFSVIWTPNIYIDNIVDVIHEGSNLVQISPDGSIWWSQQVQIKVKATMMFMKLPFDSHTISVVVASYSLDNRIIRLVAKGGTPGAPSGGVGMSSEPVDSSMWEIQNGESRTPQGLSTPGTLKIKFGGTWDYLSMSFFIARKPKYFLEQVVIQDFLFLGVSYAGFYVNPSVAPARAAMAVIPVLIMRTLANSVFRGLPQLSYSMWMADYLQVSMWLCVLCVMQFAITQYCLLREARGQTYHERLQATEKEMRTIIGEARHRGMQTLDLLDSLKLVEKGDEWVASWNYVEPQHAASDGAVAGQVSDGIHNRPLVTEDSARDDHKLTEAILGVLENAALRFKQYDKDGSGMLAPVEIRKMLASFNIYMHTKDCAIAMCKYLRDRGQLSPKDEMKAELRLGEFVEFLYDIDDYLIAVPDAMPHPFSLAVPVSRRWDIAAQWFFPIVVLIKMLIFFAIIGAYEPDSEPLVTG